MSLFLALILGFVQGLTEFLPVSSSGHLQLVSALFGMPLDELPTLMPLILHLGTLVAILVVLGRDLLQLIFSRNVWFLVLGTLPLGLALFLRGPIERLYALPLAWGICFLLTAAILWAGERFGKEAPVGKRGALVVGLLQLGALLPGLSRSGATISGARLMGWNRAAAARFSFLLAVPAIAGAALVEAWHVPTLAEQPWGAYLVGFFTAFVVGLLALRFLLRLVEKKRLTPFAWYCLFMGLCSIGYAIIR